MINLLSWITGFLITNPPEKVWKVSLPSFGLLRKAAVSGYLITWKLSRARAAVNQTIMSRAHNGCSCIPTMDCAISVLKSSNDRKKHARLNATKKCSLSCFYVSVFFLLQGWRKKGENKKQKSFRSFSTSAPSSAPSGDSSGTPWFVFHQQKGRPSLGVIFAYYCIVSNRRISLYCLWQPSAKALKEKKLVNSHVVASICLHRKLPQT